MGRGWRCADRMPDEPALRAFCWREYLSDLNMRKKCVSVLSVSLFKTPLLYFDAFSKIEKMYPRRCVGGSNISSFGFPSFRTNSKSFHSTDDRA